MKKYSIFTYLPIVNVYSQINDTALLVFYTPIIYK